MNIEEITAAMSSWVWSNTLFFMLLACGLIFSIFSKVAQWRILTHGYSCVRGDYDNPEDVGQINHFQALCAALSATIGLGNIAGVAVAVTLGGPGAVFWMWVVGVFGMALKFVECSLAVMFRDVRDVPDPSAPALMEADAENRTLEYEGEDPPRQDAPIRARGEVRGGPMWYIQHALVDPLKARGNVLWVVFKLLAVLFAVSTVLNSVGGGNMFQGWNVAAMLEQHFSVSRYASAVVVSVLVAIVIIGGIQRIGQVASRLVPIMCVIYVGGALYVILVHASDVPHHLASIVQSAFTPIAEQGACAGVSVWVAFTWGLKRACFSNEAGEGSAAMAHAAAKTDEPIREGIVAGMGPFIDTIIICTMSALVILTTNTWSRPAVGTIERLAGNEAIVACTLDVPQNMRELYRERLTVGETHTLSVQLNRGTGKELTHISAPISAVEADSGGSLESVKYVTLDISDVKSDKRDKLAVGQQVDLDIEGAEMTGFAFDTVLPGFGKYMVTLGVCLFGFSTMISWSYYGEKGAEYLMGARAILPFKFFFVTFVFLGMVAPKFQYVYDFSDATTGMMVLCNLPAVLILSPHVMRAARNYFQRLDRGDMPKVTKR